MKLTTLASIIVLSSVATSASAAEVYGGVNILQGYTLGLGYNLNDTFAFRTEVNYINASKNVNISDIDWDATLKNSSLGLFADYHPFDGYFRITSGAAFGKYKLTAHGTSSNGSYTINDNTYDATGEYLDGSVKAPTVRPYIGIGWGHSAKQGFGASFDAGVFYSKFKYNIDASSTLATNAASDIAAAEKDGQDTLDKYKFMPSIALTLTYSF